MKSIFMTLAVLLVWTGYGVAALTVRLPMEDYQTILNRLNTLQKRVEELEKQEKPKQKQTTSEAEDISRLQQDISNIYDTLDEVETKSLVDRINLGAELRTRVDFYEVTNHLLLDGTTRNEHNDNFWSNRFRINLDAELLKNMQFHGRLAAYKNWADSDRPFMLADPNSSKIPDSSLIKLDRAYVDWIPSGLPVPLAITFGRQPSSEGPPFELKENRVRQSTYPALIFDGESDGVVATLGLQRYLGLKNAGLRFFYAKGFQDDDDQTVYLDNRAGLDDLNVYAAFFETELGLRDSLLVLSYVRGDDFVDNPLFQDANLGDMDLYGAHLQFNRFLGSNLDFFVSGGLNRTHPNGQTGTLAIDPATGTPIVAGLLSADGQSDHSGWSVYAGFRYTIPWEALNKPKLGFEYNYGSEYWFSYTQGSTDIFNRLATRGNAYDVYYLQPFNKYLYLRAGCTLIDYQHTLSGWHIGEPQDTNEELKNYYVLLDARF